jgi:alpha-mannosidase
LDRFFGSPYASQHLDKLLDRHRSDAGEHVRITHWAAPSDAKPGFDEARPLVDAHGAEIRKGHRFGPSWSNHWLKVELSLPEWMKAEETVICAYSLRGR